MKSPNTDNAFNSTSKLLIIISYSQAVGLIVYHWVVAQVEVGGGSTRVYITQNGHV